MTDQAAATGGSEDQIVRAVFVMAQRDPKPTEQEFRAVIGPRLRLAIVDAKIEEIRKTSSAVITERVRELAEEKWKCEVEILKNPLVGVG